MNLLTSIRGIEMTMSFDELVERDKSRNIKAEIKESRSEMLKLRYPDAFEAGAQSQQSDIDKLKQALKTSLAAYKCVCLERDELQRRIDEACIDLHSAKSWGEVYGVIHKLKGERND